MRKIIYSPIWLILFLLLLLVNGVTLFMLTQLISSEPSMKEHEQTTAINHSSSNYILLDEETVSKYLISDDPNTKLSFEDHHIIIQSKTKVYGLNVKTQIDTVPSVSQNGNLILKVKDISIGQLPISQKQQLKLVKKVGNLPKDVSVDIDNEQFIYQLDALKFGKNQLKLKTINSKNQWVFKLMLKE
nr:DUF2140 family protein [Macrococcus sp. DPC7161]